MVEYTITLSNKENKLLSDLSDQYETNNIKELVLMMAIELREERCIKCGTKLITGAKLCRNCGKLFIYDLNDIKEELEKLGYKKEEKENPVTEFYEPDVKRISKLTKEGKIETDVPKYLKEKREAIK